MNISNSKMYLLVTNYTQRDADYDTGVVIAKITAMLVLFCASTIFGLIPYKLSKWYNWDEANSKSSLLITLLLGFGAGVLLATTFLHLLPEVSETISFLQEEGKLPNLKFHLAELLMCTGFFAMYLVEELVHSYLHYRIRLQSDAAKETAFQRGLTVRNSSIVLKTTTSVNESKVPQTLNNNPPTLISLEIIPQTIISEKITKSTNLNESQDQIQINDINIEKIENDKNKKNTVLNMHNQQNHHDHHSHQHHSHIPETNQNEDLIVSSIRGLLIVLALSVHELFEGLAIGLETSESATWYMFGAVSTHKLVLAFCVGVELAVNRTKFLLILVYVITFAFVSPLGIGIGILLSNGTNLEKTEIASVFLQGLATGTLLYVVFFEILSKIKRCLKQFLTTLLGFLFMFGLQIAIMMDEPRFAQPIPNVTVAVGRDANLPCVVEHLGTYKVAWIHIDRQMILTIHRHVISRIPRYSITYDNANTWLLHVNQAQQDDRGYYMCQVNTNPMISQVGYLQVVVPPNILDIESTPSSVAVRENQSINMTCRADGFPAPKIIWRREDGQSITVERKKKVMVYDGEILPLTKVSRNEMGAYLCIATNGVPPSVSKRIILDVEFSPMIWVPNQLVGAPGGTDVTIDCHTEAHPRAIIYWVYNSVMVLPSKKYIIDYTENSYRAHMKLTIKNLQHGDFGNYRCISKNSLGETEGSIRVYEIPLPSTPSKQITHVISEQPKETPRNESSRIVQPEVVFPMRSDASHGSPSNPIDRKGTVAIGQSVFYTDFPPKEYGQPSGSTKLFSILSSSIILSFYKIIYISIIIFNINFIFYS